MYIETLTITVKPGFADQVVHRFGQEAAVEKAEGFVDLSVMVRSAGREEEEVMVLIRWESEAHWKQWELSEPHLEGHRRERQQGKPEWVLSSRSRVYEVKAVKHPAPVK
ncbi:antibiotic biosynthesis monooxygenase [Paenibacillus silviterrae]|uniref:antibiotic biosynthesis monooxygenase n=1 Tax=Paenibacillus silviterrae TaxID=3242194 RepID=UPI002542AF23|nr:antibiotic biosynthesis monooxygenase [Paenibacillus chinjuensis]